MKIRFTKEYSSYKSGAVVEANDISAKHLIDLGVVEEVKDKKEIIEGFETKEEPKKKRVRRTKAQIEADKKK